MLEGQRHLDQTGYAGGGVGVSDVGLDRADATEAGLRRGRLERLRHQEDPEGAEEPDPEHVTLGMKVKITTFPIGAASAGPEAIGFGFAPLEANCWQVTTSGSSASR